MQEMSTTCPKCRSQDAWIRTDSVKVNESWVILTKVACPTCEATKTFLKVDEKVYIPKDELLEDAVSAIRVAALNLSR